MSTNITLPLKGDDESGAQATLNYWMSPNERAVDGAVRVDYDRHGSDLFDRSRANVFVSEGDQ